MCPWEANPCGHILRKKNKTGSAGLIGSHLDRRYLTRLDYLPVVTFWSTHVFYSRLTLLTFDSWTNSIYFTYYIGIWLTDLDLWNGLNVTDFKIFHLTGAKHIGGIRLEYPREIGGGHPAQLNSCLTCNTAYVSCVCNTQHRFHVCLFYFIVLFCCRKMNRQSFIVCACQKMNRQCFIVCACLKINRRCFLVCANFKTQTRQR